MSGVLSIQNDGLTGTSVVMGLVSASQSALESRLLWLVRLLGMTSKVGPKGQVVIPKEMRDRLGIRPGDRVAFSLADGGLLVEAVDAKAPLKARFEGSGMLGTLELEHRHEVAHDR